MIGSTSSYLLPPVFQPFQNLVAAESTRHGGISPFPFASLNVGLNTNDSPENVQENRRRFFAAIGIDDNQVASSLQVHGDRILTVTKPGRFEGYDALITNRPNQFLTVTVADCTPILIYDAGQHAVAAIHAGWRGTTARIVEKTVQAMQIQFGTRPSDCYAYVGTCIDQCSFEVGNEVAEQFDEPHKQFDAGKQKYTIDLKAANVAQLIKTGVPLTQIGVSPYSTVLNNSDFFSYRSENGNTGRMLAVIGFQSVV